MENINYIKKMKIDFALEFINTLKYTELENIIKLLDEYYFNGNPLISDKKYDSIRKYINEKFQNTSICNKIGYEPQDKIKLKYYMGSENKTYVSDNKLTDWINNYGTDTIVISAKADGISLLWDLDINKIYTRGDGEYGKDVSHFLEYFNFSDYNDFNIKEVKNYISCIRGELIMDKPGNRNIVAGQLNRIKIDNEISKKIYFVAYEIVYPRLSQNDQFELLNKFKIRTVQFMIVNISELNYPNLGKIYEKFSSELNYSIDGLIIRNTNINELTYHGNPYWSICYKHDDDKFITTVQYIKWNLSKNNIYVPVAIIEPIQIENSKINKVTCYNAKYVISNNLGKGSVIEIIKRGGVIPKISKIIKKSDVVIDLPNGTLQGANLIHVGNTKDGDIKKIINFFNILGFKNANKLIITDLYDRGYINVLELISKDINIPELHKKKNYHTLLNIIDNIKKREFNLPLFISALSLNKISYKRACSIFDKFPNFIDKKNEIDYSIIDGIGKELSKSINEELMNNYEFIIDCMKYMNIIKVLK
jgi:NAD-dependent DNA ligase